MSHVLLRQTPKITRNRDRRQNSRIRNPFYLPQKGQLVAAWISDKNDIIQKHASSHIIIFKNNSLELGLGLGLLEDGVELGGLHDVALDLELARHE